MSWTACECHLGIEPHVQAIHLRVRTKIPIKDPRIFFLVQCFYFSIPFLIGVPLMKYITPDHAEMEQVRGTPACSRCTADSGSHRACPLCVQRLAKLHPEGTGHEKEIEAQNKMFDEVLRSVPQQSKQ